MRTITGAALVLASSVLVPRASYAQWMPYPPPYYVVYDNTGSARIQVTPRNAKVYVDGYFVGVVDDYDGTFQRLHVPVGEHQLEIHLEGYRPFSQRVMFVRGSTMKVSHALEPLPAGETSPPPPKPDATAQPAPYSPPGQRPPGPSRPGSESAYGSLLLRVQPSDALVLVDGQPWTAPPNEPLFVIELGEGMHRIEVQKEGFRSYANTIRVRRGETVRLNVNLTKGTDSRAE
jgi:hypothetical protein